MDTIICSSKIPLAHCDQIESLSISYLCNKTLSYKDHTNAHVSTAIIAINIVNHAGLLKMVAFALQESRHTLVCCAAQEARVPHHEYIDRKKENVIFTHM